MAHEIEFVDGQAQMAYVGEVPWHGLGVEVSNDLTPEEMLNAAGLNWRVEAFPAISTLADGTQIDTGHSALVRDTDNRVLDVITNDWNPMQNADAFDFFNEFVEMGDMEMHTAGSLKGGKIVWALAKVHESFELFDGKDRVDSYLLFTNPHTYGQSIDVRFTPIRVVCNNTLTLSLNKQSKSMVKVSHRREFNPELVKETLGVAKMKLSKYADIAQYLSNKRFTDESMEDYFKRVFPVITNKEDSTKELSKSAKYAIEEALENQPGAELGKGSFWALFNTITFMTDHVIGRSADNRLTSAWYGANKNLKNKALEVALEMADAA